MDMMYKNSEIFEKFIYTDVCSQNLYMEGANDAKTFTNLCWSVITLIHGLK